MVSVHFPDGQYFLSCSPHTGKKKKKKRRSLCRQARAKNKSSPSGVVVPGENWLPLLQDIEKRKPIRLIRTLFLWYLKFECFSWILSLSGHISIVTALPNQTETLLPPSLLWLHLATRLAFPVRQRLPGYQYLTGKLLDVLAEVWLCAGPLSHTHKSQEWWSVLNIPQRFEPTLYNPVRLADQVVRRWNILDSVDDVL